MTRKPSKPNPAAELEDLRARLTEAEEVLRAIRNVDVDAVVVGGERGEQVYTLSGADRGYRQLIETMSEGALTLSADGVILYCNLRLAEMLGRPLDQVLGSSLRNYLPPADQQALEAILAQARTAASRREINLKVSDDRLLPVFLSASRLQSEGAEIIFCLVLTDLTEQKSHEQIVAAQEALRLSESQLQATLDTTADGILAVDNTGKVIKANRRFAYLWRIPQSLMESRDDRALLGFVLNQLSEPEAFLKKVQALYGSDAEDKDTLCFKDGRVLERYSAPMLMAGGVTGRVWSFRDITERKQAEDALLASQRNYRLLVEGLPQKIFLKDRHCVYISCNENYARDLGIASHDIAGKTDDDFYPHELAEKYRADDRRVMDTGVTAGLEERYVRDGKESWVHTVKTPVNNEAGERLGVLGIFWDVTERKLAEEKLARLNQQSELILCSAAEGILGLDLQGNHTFVNPAAAKMLGYEAEELLGRPSHSTWHHTKPDGSPYPREVCEIYAAYRDGTVHRASTEVFWRKDGTSFPVEYASTPIWEQGRLAGAVVTFSDITERKRSEQVIFRANRALKALGSCNTALIHASDEGWLLKEICGIVVEIAGYHRAWVGFPEHDPQKTVRPVVHAGYGEGYMERAEITWDDTALGRGPAGTAIRTRKPQIVHDALTNPQYELWRHNAVTLGYRSVLGLPLVSAGALLGVLCIYAVEDNGFDPEEVKLLTELADDLAFGIATLRTRDEHRESAERLRRGMESTIEALAGTLEMRDAYTAGHQRRVAELAAKIAGELGYSEDEIHGIHLAATIHDLGKIQVPAEILSKPAKLTKLEYELIKTHAQAGYDILSDIDFPWPIAQIVYQHHERLDGSGYPRGLKGDEILLGARILAVADTIEAMSSHRPYRPGLGIDAALDEITKHRSRTYDAAAVDACVKLFREKQFEFSS